MNKILIIGDVHGRIFWKEAINHFPKEQYPDLSIVFLGDYVDPYDHEGISRIDAINNFKEIIDVAKSDNRIHLLIGNHDMHYWYDAPYKSRCDHENYDIIKKMFIDNFDMFNVAYEETINNEKYLFTHAGVSSFWLKHLHIMGTLASSNIKDKESDDYKLANVMKDMEPTADNLNMLKSVKLGQHNLWCVSWVRGGDNNCGSCIWEDLSEWAYEGMDIPGLWQIFGHSRWSKSDPDSAYINYDRKFACVDTASAYILTDTGLLIKFEHKKERFKK